jgi:hypothetical protein
MTLKPHDPAAAVRRAWNTMRLNALQAMVNETILRLQQLEPAELLGRPLSTLEQQLESNPIRAALQACSEELRDESGMAGAHELRLLHSQLVRERMLDQPLEWTETFREAFEKYRLVAGHAIDRSLGAPPG